MRILGRPLEPSWVANQIVALSSGNFKYKYAKLLRDPNRVEVVECLDNYFEDSLALT